VSKHTLYAWKSKYGLEGSEAEKLRSLRDENGRLRESSENRSQGDQHFYSALCFPGSGFGASSFSGSSPRCGRP